MARDFQAPLLAGAFAAGHARPGWSVNEFGASAPGVKSNADLPEVGDQKKGGARIVPCFTPETLIATPRGERRVDMLRVGDRVITRDNGLQEIQWLGKRRLTPSELARDHHLRPVRIRQGALGGGLPERDMLVSPNHRVLVASDKTALYFEDREVLAAAKHLTGMDGIAVADTLDVTYIHFMFSRHEVVLSDGAWTESFQPGDQSLEGMGNAQKNEIFELFPELETREGQEVFATARRSLRRHEARMLVN